MRFLAGAENGCVLCAFFFLAEKGGVRAGFLERAVFFFSRREAVWFLCCVCVPVQKKNCSSGFAKKLQQQVFYTA